MNPPSTQPAIPGPNWRARPNFGLRTAKRGWALVRAIALIGFTGFLVAAVAATIFAGLVIGIDGQLP